MPIRLDLVRGFTPTAVTNALLRPSAFGWPDRTNAGVPASASLTDSGPLVITTPGAVVEDLLIDATGNGLGIEVRAPDVSIRRVHVITTPQGGGGCIKQVNGATGMHIAFSTLEYAAPGSYDAVIGDSHYTVEWCLIDGVSEGPRFGDHCIIRNTYIGRLLGTDPLAHADGAQTLGAINFVFDRNTVDLSGSSPNFANAALIVGTEGGPTSGRITRNLLSGGGFVLRIGASNFPMTGLVVEGNRFGRLLDFGPTAVDVDGIDGLTWQDNVWDDGGGLVLAA